ncbi:hypothetical protein E2562_034618 [Oryza meyeriana var. granulata]|uniref:Uncharacterized protein n=1 Tax=Oryza meyeriana var. granulata TaxID=110450 RepID=A0A6G1DS58_9ORYZ|nr:hypothetical protein E2562_034618 [Oryza meyeriana var. granulata]
MAVHVMILGSYTEGHGEGSEQRAWVEQDLAGVDKRRTLWVVAVVHALWRLVQPLASAQLWMVTEGNHEMERMPPIVNGVNLTSSPFAACNAQWHMPHEPGSIKQLDPN